jgi:hypothetical protein
VVGSDRKAGPGRGRLLAGLVPRLHPLLSWGVWGGALADARGARARPCADERRTHDQGLEVACLGLEPRTEHLDVDIPFRPHPESDGRRKQAAKGRLASYPRRLSPLLTMTSMVTAGSGSPA